MSPTPRAPKPFGEVGRRRQEDLVLRVGRITHSARCHRTQSHTSGTGRRALLSHGIHSPDSQPRAWAFRSNIHHRMRQRQRAKYLQNILGTQVNAFLRRTPSLRRVRLVRSDVKAFRATLWNERGGGDFSALRLTGPAPFFAELTRLGWQGFCSSGSFHHWRAIERISPLWLGDQCMGKFVDGCLGGRLQGFYLPE
ncbi:hypothetical protein FA13DRAFT_17205 [Coprinellus micaceus]|uniref:Uncharacterized protein n=1 Tax=Coprinellus micaceus TaxID=71717 RepID=A0A4Y7U1K2_COPMI|nr:hypothetical protein FA13DRAFT_17205 [Coprinellus micaceus]